jgi:O-succinylbenzoate synthase
MLPRNLVHLMQILPAGSQLRLDANGGLTWDEANRWLELCDRLSNSPDHAQIECVEQPLPVDQFEALLRLSQQYQTPIALDESVATLEQLQTCYQNGWRGIVVIKAAIAGFPSRLRHLCQTYEIDRIWSSVFETAIARQFIFSHLIDVLPPCDRALGFGVRQWFTESVNEQFDPDPIYPTAFERLWQHL